MALAVFFGYFAMGDLIFQLIVQRSYSVMTNDVLISVPLFVFMGYLVERANILDRLFRSLQLAAGPVPASLAIATLVTCAIFATATGIIGACVTLMGLLAFPAMLRAGYDVKLASGVVCAGGCLGILIPPSVMLILYGATAGVSVVKLYAGAVLPGHHAGQSLRALHDYHGAAEPEAGAAAAARRTRRPLQADLLGAGHVVCAAGRVDRRGARLDHRRARHAVGSRRHGLARRAAARRRLRRGLFAALGAAPHKNLRHPHRAADCLRVRLLVHRPGCGQARVHGRSRRHHRRRPRVCCLERNSNSVSSRSPCS